MQTNGISECEAEVTRSSSSEKRASQEHVNLNGLVYLYQEIRFNYCLSEENFWYNEWRCFSQLQITTEQFKKMWADIAREIQKIKRKKKERKHHHWLICRSPELFYKVFEKTAFPRQKWNWSFFITDLFFPCAYFLFDLFLLLVSFSHQR